jgi:CTP synthase
MWSQVAECILEPKGEVTIGIVGKYTGLADAYKSLNEALSHGGIFNKVKVNLNWIESEEINESNVNSKLNICDGILVPGGFGERGSEGKILAIKFARENKVPYFGICFGMQLAVIEMARNLIGIKDASSSEFGNCTNSVVGLMTEWKKGDTLESRSANGDLGGSMRLGAYQATINKNSMAYDVYKSESISERHRHRYEVNKNYEEKLNDKGVNFSGFSPDGLLPEIVEIKDHPWFIGVQFHPELKSKPFDPHPLFKSFIKASVDQSKVKNAE